MRRQRKTGRQLLLAASLALCLTGCGGTGPSASADGVDVDLTKLSSTMVYSEVYNMLENPEEYVGKTVRMGGTFDVYEADTRNYYACVIQDALACCAEGLEFVCADERSYPEDFPALDAPITVTGVFETYTEGEYQYVQVKDAKLVF